MAKDPEFFTALEVAKKIRISERTCRTLIRAGKIHAVKISERVYRVPAAEMQRLASVGV